MEQQDLGDEFAEFREESIELAKLMESLARETWPVWDYPPDPPEATWRSERGTASVR